MTRAGVRCHNLARYGQSRRNQRLLLLIVAGFGIIVMAVVVSMASNARSQESPNYQTEQDVPNAALHSLDEYVNETGGASFLGMTVRKQQIELNSGRQVQGLEIVDVALGSPAASAGLQGCRQTVQNILKVAAVGAAMIFPPAMLALPIVAVMPLGETPDLIIAVDASRVTNVGEFEDQIRDVEPGEIVYLTILHRGTREQVRLLLPPREN